MKESEAWLILAEEFDAQRTESEWLCCCLDAFNAARNPRLHSVPTHTLYGMQERIREAIPIGLAAYGVREYVEPDVRGARVLACLMFGQQAKDEERSR